MSRTGRLIFLKQLESLRNSHIEVEADCLPDTDRKMCAAYAALLEVPEYLRAAFNAYCLEYIDAAGRGVFSNGIHEKVHHFYGPVIEIVSRETDIDGVRILPEPSDGDRFCFLAVAVGRKNQNLPVPFLLYRGCFGARQPFFTRVPEGVYEEINRVYKSAKVNAVAGLRANGVPLPAERPAGIFVRYSVKCGEKVIPCTALIPYAGNVPAEDIVRGYLESLDGASIDGWVIVPRTDYTVLKSYM